MKEAITKFDLEAAFKALDEIDIPVAEKIKANRPVLTEIFSRKSKFDSLMEEYYDISSTEELGDAQEAREAEVAKAKLARIEKIVDLDADSPEDLLTSYVGKYIIQCPQCMTLFYKAPEDVVEAEDDPETVNVNEVCQHCGNEAGYTLIGKVDEAAPEEADNFEPVEELPAEETSEEPTEDLGDLEELDLNLEDTEEDPEKTEEAFSAHDGETLVEELADDKELDAKLEAHNEYIEYLRTAIAQEEEKLEKASNEQVKVAIQRNIDAFKADLENALPDAVKNDMAMEEAPIEDTPVDETPVEETPVQEESLATEESNALTEALHEDKDLDVSADEFEELIKSPEFQKPISDTEARAMINDEKEAEEADVQEALEDTTAKSTYGCSNCGYEVELSDKEYDGCCPNCHEHHGEFIKLDENVLTEAITRAGKCDWVLSKAVDKNGQKKYSKFLVCYFEPKFSTKKNKRKEEPITKPIDDPVTALKNGYLIPSAEYGRPEAKDKYKDAENIAKGRSMQRDCGPVFVFLAKDASLANANFLCQYFDGNLHAESDQLESYIKDVKGNKKATKSGSDQADFEKVQASKVTKGSKVKINDQTVEITDVATSELDSSTYQISVKYEDGTSKTLPVNANYVFTVMREAAALESLDTIMSGLDELQESTLETLISDSLVEAYGNVAGFRLAECAYNDNKFTVDGTIYFTSGNTRKTTYAFTESWESDGKINLCGLNEKLGLDKQFTLTCRVDNKTLITESFKRSK